VRAHLRAFPLNFHNVWRVYKKGTREHLVVGTDVPLAHTLGQWLPKLEHEGGSLLLRLVVPTWQNGRRVAEYETIFHALACADAALPWPLWEAGDIENANSQPLGTFEELREGTYAGEKIDESQNNSLKNLVGLRMPNPPFVVGFANIHSLRSMLKAAMEPPLLIPLDPPHPELNPPRRDAYAIDKPLVREACFGAYIRYESLEFHTRKLVDPEPVRPLRIFNLRPCKIQTPRHSRYDNKPLVDGYEIESVDDRYTNAFTRQRDTYANLAEHATSTRLIKTWEHVRAVVQDVIASEQAPDDDDWGTTYDAVEETIEEHAKDYELSSEEQSALHKRARAYYDTLKGGSLLARVKDAYERNPDAASYQDWFADVPGHMDTAEAKLILGGLDKIWERTEPSAREKGEDETEYENRRDARMDKRAAELRRFFSLSASPSVSAAAAAVGAKRGLAASTLLAGRMRRRW